MAKIIYNAIRTPDGTVLESLHEWDCKTHTDANGEWYMNDGGNAYWRRSVNIEPYTDLSVTTDDEHIKIREHFRWQRILDKDNNPLPVPQILVLKDMVTDHIEAILNNNFAKASYIVKIFLDELKYRGVFNV